MLVQKQLDLVNVISDILIVYMRTVEIGRKSKAHQTLYEVNGGKLYSFYVLEYEMTYYASWSLTQQIKKKMRAPLYIFNHRLSI